MFSYQCKQETGGSWNITYKLNEEYLQAQDVLMECGRIMVNNLKALNQDEFLLKEYLFGNLLRSAIDRVNPKNTRLTRPNIPAHIGMAAELYTNFDRTRLSRACFTSKVARLFHPRGG